LRFAFPFALGLAAKDAKEEIEVVFALVSPVKINAVVH
jgi:hypothetical protein